MSTLSLPTSRETFYTKLLFKFVEEGNALKAKDVLQNGANPNYRNEDDETPLHIAAEKGYIKVMQILLDAYANPYLTKMHSTNIPQKRHIYKPQKYIFLTPLGYACIFDRLESVKCLIEYGKYDVNFKLDELTPLAFAEKYHCSKEIQDYLKFVSHKTSVAKNGN